MKIKKKCVRSRKPEWLRVPLPEGEKFRKVKKIVDEHGLNTICTSGRCPNMGECWGNGTATLMILGDICTRACKFCAVKTGKPLPVDLEEPKKVAESVKLMGLKHCVLTSVDRDDLDDGGAFIWSETIKEIKKLNPETTIEVLVPDFQGNTDLLQQVIDAKPNVISHNLETARRLTKGFRSRADYDTSLKMIKYISKSGLISKSGIMLGIGETEDDVYEVMDDLLNAGCQVMTIGQYLQATKDNIPVQEYIKPETFEKYRLKGLEKGFHFVESSPLVRSSYHAEKHVAQK